MAEAKHGIDEKELYDAISSGRKLLDMPDLKPVESLDDIKEGETLVRVKGDEVYILPKVALRYKAGGEKPYVVLAQKVGDEALKVKYSASGLSIGRARLMPADYTIGKGDLSQVYRLKPPGKSGYMAGR